ncbi:MAG: DnaJ domain-containing protein [Cyanobacteria bacterium J06627_3]
MERLHYYYQILELEYGSTQEEIKQAYRKLAQQWHPDKFSNQPEQLKTARAKFELIKEAYEQLLRHAHPDRQNLGPRVSVRSLRAEDYYQKGIASIQAGNPHQAVESFSQAILKNPDYVKAYQARAFTLEQLGLHQRANADFKKVAELRARNQSAASQEIAVETHADADIAFQQGLVQFKARKYGAAIETLSRAIRINPHHKEAYRYRSQAYFRRGYDDLADADFQRMRELEQQTTPSVPKASSSKATPSSGWQCLHTLSRHTGIVSAVAITRDGRNLITGSYDKTLRLWSVKTGKLLKTLSDYANEIHCVALSGDGKLVATGSTDNTVKIWDIRTGELTRSLGSLFSGHSGTVTDLAFSPNNQTLVSVSLDQTVRLWSLKTSKEIYALKDYPDSILALAMGWDGKTIVYGGEGDILSMRHTKTGKLIRSFPIKGQPNRAIALSRQGSLLAAGSAAEIVMWNRHYQKRLFQLKGHSEAVSSLVFSADSQILISGSYDQTVRLWNANTGEHIDTFTGHQAPVHSVACSLDGNVIVSGSADKTVKVWQQS